MTFCVGSLYRSIPYNLSIEAKSYYLTNYETNLHPRFTEKLVRDQSNLYLKTIH